MNRRCLSSLGALLFFMGTPMPGAGQTNKVPSETWRMSWSPLAPLAESIRPPAPSAIFSLLLAAPPSQVGLHWTGGNPGGLPFDVVESRADFRALYSAEDGTYRRPLDPGEIRLVQASARGWTPVDASGAAVGAVTIQRTFFGSGAPSNVARPYGMSPHLFADDSGADLAQTLVRLDGAGGWRLGPLGLGLSAAYQGWDTRTGESLFPRFQRGSRSGLTAGVVREVGAGVLGLRARWLSEAEALSVSNRSAEISRVYRFEGFGEPIVEPLGYRKGYSRRIDRDGWGVGLSGAMTLGVLRWVVFGEWESQDERQSSQSINDPPTDRWSADGPRLGTAVRRFILNGRGEIVTHITWSRFSGEGTRAGLEEEGTLFDATEEVWDGTVQAWTRVAEDWTFATHFNIARQDRTRRDLLARMMYSLTIWRPSMALEVAHTFGRFALSLGAGVAWHTSRGGIPDPTYRQEAYRDWIGTEHVYDATESLSRSGLLSFRWVIPRGDRLLLVVRFDHSAPRASDVRLPLGPDGDRGRLNLCLRWIR